MGTHMPHRSRAQTTKDLETIANEILRRFASTGDNGKDVMTCRDLYRLLVILGFPLRRFKAIITGVDEPEERVEPSYEQVGSYNLRRLMGSGHKGACCYLGEHIEGLRKVAIKWPAVEAEVVALKDLQ